MCGIFGIIFPKNNTRIISNRKVRMIISNLLKFSTKRGKEASGLALKYNNQIEFVKYPINGIDLMKKKSYEKLLDKIEENFMNGVAIMGHSRLVTNGNEDNHQNNQPVIKKKLASIHNGIIVNDEELWEKFKIEREFDVDTEIILTLLDYFFKNKKDLVKAIKATFNELYGTASIITMFSELNYILAATNNGSLYCNFLLDDKDQIQGYIFASEKYILKEVNNKVSLNENFPNSYIKKINANEAILVNIENFQNSLNFSLTNSLEKNNIDHQISYETIKQRLGKISDLTDRKIDKVNATYVNQSLNSIEDKNDNRQLLMGHLEAVNNLKRCTKCVLPHTFPYITFDDDGVCNLCASFRKIEYRGNEKLKEQFFSKGEKSDYDAMIMLSGGRDSSYAAHYLVNELNLNVVTYTYDWGMITDLARRNVARICGKLGLENILVSADIRKKRKNIKLNLESWLKKPKLGMIPLLMAGDKHWFYHANKIQKELGVENTVLATNLLEKSDFKTGFCGVTNYDIERKNIKYQLLGYYGKQFLSNPSYINRSIYDTFTGYISNYFLPRKYIHFYDFIEWNEKKIENTLIDKYDWEISKDTASTWRIGDGTASFYNYVYHRIAGFSEIETFRSNQIRQGLLKRDDALKIIESENFPRYPSIKWYLTTIGLGDRFNEIIKLINSQKTLY